MADIKLPPLPIDTHGHDEDAFQMISAAELRARDLKVARVVLEAAAQSAELWHANGIEVEIAREIRALEFTHD